MFIAWQPPSRFIYLGFQKVAPRQENPQGQRRGVARTETILVVEDNDAVRSFTTDRLRDFGFNVIEAAAAEALKILDQNPRIDLLFTRAQLYQRISESLESR